METMRRPAGKDEFREVVRGWIMLAFGLSGMGRHWRVQGRGIMIFGVS